MGTRGLGVGGVLGGDSEGTAKFDDLHELLGAEQGFLLQAHDVDVGFVVLPQFQLVTVFEQVEQSAAVDLEE